MDIASPIRLSTLAHGGGCGCKLAPAVLQDLLADQPTMQPFSQLLVGTETGDDAAVWQLDDENCVIVTTDFFMPMVDDPFDFGRIAATNAISDVYAMGGTPIMALAILGMPVNKMPAEMIREILKGGSSICAEAGIPVAGGHSIDAPEPIYGLAVIGTCKLSSLRKNSGARPGDTLILTKAIGVGIYSAAFKKQELDSAGYDEMMASVTLLNRVGAELGKDSAVHAVTDVTGFGILGHALEMARGSNAGISLDYAALPFLKQAEKLTQGGFVTGASTRNWASYGHDVQLPDDYPLWKQQLLTDPQTSGGLLISCAPEDTERLLNSICCCGYPSACIVGKVTDDAGRVTVTG
ncbi:selenide, water dikinase SelD [Brucella anthropi]|uniref:selenide, water dikinase SelD n=1 Tax=Brucella TaxID=234 RepID=UPI00124C4A35|nr:selenide, water dikinase SelD [Brucella anthropi]KAB2757061.1 selenide, water dikinase SelD [Brucella anthropi]MBA8860968.1 selenide,water dikinase [Brucella anthropi]MBM6397070.1 selenide, water dikinase SelD [Brucella anthropi]